MIFSCCVAIANYAIYMSTIDYMVASYGVYAASATGGNGFARDFLAGVSAMYASPLYEGVGGELRLEYVSVSYVSDERNGSGSDCDCMTC